MPEVVVREWTKLFGTPLDDLGKSVSIAADGSIYITGGTKVTPDREGVDGDLDAFLSKYNSDGSREWTQLQGTNSYDSAQSVSIAADGSIYISGHTGGDLDGQTNSGGSDAFLTRYSSDGSKEWTQLLGSPSPQFAEKVSAAADGSIYITGWSHGDLDGQINNGVQDAFLSKYNSDGSKEWTQLLGSSSIDIAFSVGAASDGSVYITGGTQGDLDGQTNNGGLDIFLSKYNSDGSKEWTQLLGSNADESGSSVGIAADGSIYITGWSHGDLGGQINNGGRDAFLSKYNSDGSREWTQLLGSNADESGSSVSIAADGSVYITGGTQGDLDGQTNSGDSDAFVSKYTVVDYDRTFEDQQGDSNNVFDHAYSWESDLYIYYGGDDVYTAGNGADGLSVDFDQSQTSIARGTAGGFQLTTPSGVITLYDIQIIHFKDVTLELESSGYLRTFLDQQGGDDNTVFDHAYAWESDLYVYYGGDDVYTAGGGVDGLSVDFDQSQTSIARGTAGGFQLTTPSGIITLYDIQNIHFKDATLELESSGYLRTFLDQQGGDDNTVFDHAYSWESDLYVYYGGDDVYTAGNGADGLYVDFDQSQTSITRGTAGGFQLTTPLGIITLYDIQNIHFKDATLELESSGYLRTFLDQQGGGDNNAFDHANSWESDLYIYYGGDDVYTAGGGVDGLSVDFDRSQTTLTQYLDGTYSLVTPKGSITLNEIEWIHFKDQSLDLLSGQQVFASTPYADALVSGLGVYKLLKNSQEITLRNGRGRTFSDQSSRWWDITQAFATETGFQVLLEGEGRRRAGRYLVWSTDASGVITDQTRWMTGDQMLAGGYEDVFNRDFNNDGITGAPPAIDDNGDGLIDGSSTYQLFKENQAFDLTNRGGRKFSDRSSRWWDITQAFATEIGFQVLLEGEGRRRAGRYQVWSADASGVITDQTRWMTGDQMLAGGYEDVFNRDFNNDGITGAPPAIDDNGDGLIDGSSTYQLFKENQAFDLTNSGGRTFSDRSSRWWDITQASATETGFQVLLEGQRGRRRGRYQVWSADASGVITDQSRWMTGDQMLTGGYEEVFNRDFNNDGFVAIDNSSLV